MSPRYWPNIPLLCDLPVPFPKNVDYKYIFCNNSVASTLGINRCDTDVGRISTLIEDFIRTFTVFSTLCINLPYDRLDAVYTMRNVNSASLGFHTAVFLVWLGSWSRAPLCKARSEQCWNNLKSKEFRNIGRLPTVMWYLGVHYNLYSRSEVWLANEFICPRENKKLVFSANYVRGKNIRQAYEYIALACLIIRRNKHQLEEKECKYYRNVLLK